MIYVVLFPLAALVFFLAVIVVTFAKDPMYKKFAFWIYKLHVNRIVKGSYKVEHNYSSTWNVKTLLDWSTKVEKSVHSFRKGQYLTFQTKLGVVEIFSFRFDLVDFTITNFSCKDYLVPREKEKEFVQLLLKQMFHFLSTEYLEQTASQRIGEVLQSEMNKRAEKESDSAPSIPEMFEGVYGDIKELSNYLQKFSHLLDVEKSHYVKSYIEERIPKALHVYETSPSDIQDDIYEEIQHTLSDVKHTFSQWKEEVNRQLKMELQKSLSVIRNAYK